MASTHPLATADQRSIEETALRLVERPDVRAARERARAMLLADPAAQDFSARLGLDRALDLWMLALAMREANGDPNRPKVIWNVDNTPRHWFGHTYPGAAVAVDNPDNMNREIPIDGDGRYVLTIRFSEKPASLSLVMEVEPEHHAGIGENLGAISTLDLDPQPGKHLTVTVDSDPAGDRKLHLQTRPGTRIQLYARDSHSDWSQIPAHIAVERLDPVSRPERDEDELAAAVTAAAEPFVRFWLGFKDTFLGWPEPNRIVGPQGRIGGWGFLAGGRFALEDGQGLLVRTRAVDAQYTGFQVADPFTIAPDPIHRTSSLNCSQVEPDADGRISYVLSASDPGTCNWIDTVGLSRGWFLLRWQGVAPEADPAIFIDEVRVVDLADLPAGIRRTTLAERIAKLSMRAAQHRARTMGV